MTHRRRRWSVPVFCALAVLAQGAGAQPFSERSLELEGETIRFAIREFAPNANAVDDKAKLEPRSALETAKLLGRYLSAGSSEEAAMLSNSPRRRYEVFRDYRNAVGEEGFKQVFGEYFEPQNRVVAEIAIGDHSLLVWDLKGANRYAGQFFVRIEDRTLLDDVPGPARTQLRRILEAIRAGRLALPGQ